MAYNTLNFVYSYAIRLEGTLNTTGPPCPSFSIHIHLRSSLTLCVALLSKCVSVVVYTNNPAVFLYR